MNENQEENKPKVNKETNFYKVLLVSLMTILTFHVPMNSTEKRLYITLMMEFYCDIGPWTLQCPYYRSQKKNLS